MLVIYGHADQAVPLDKSASRLPGLTKDLKLVVIEDGPHAIAWTHAGGAPEIEFLGDGHEVTQLAEFHENHCSAVGDFAYQQGESWSWRRRRQQCNAVHMIERGARRGRFPAGPEASDLSAARGPSALRAVLAVRGMPSPTEVESAVRGIAADREVTATTAELTGLG